MNADEIRINSKLVDIINSQVFIMYSTNYVNCRSILVQIPAKYHNAANFIAKIFKVIRETISDEIEKETVITDFLNMLEIAEFDMIDNNESKKVILFPNYIF